MHGDAERSPTGGPPARTRRGRRPGRFGAAARVVHRLLAIAVIAMFTVTGGTLANPSSAIAAEYPTWEQLQAAKANTAAAAAAVTQIKNLIAQLAINVETTRAEAEKRTEELFIAQQEYDDAVRIADEIQAQASSAATEAAAAEQNAGQLAAQLYRTGGTDLSVNLLLEAGGVGADELLAKLGSMDKMVERTASIYEQANEKSNAAQSLADQAQVARGERERLRIAAEEALAAAQAAQAAAEAALAESEAKKIELDQQLKFMQDTEATTAAAYEEGERKRKEEEERRRKAEEERRRQEAAAAAAAAAAGRGSGGGGGGGSPAGAVQGSGWAKPAYGGITGYYGPRPVYCGGGYCSNPFHYAVDIGTGCSAPLYAAAGGRVVFAGWSGSYGNFIKIDHGGGIYTGYAHIRPGGIFVGTGQGVSAGQNIASSGTTGASTGCHLHFEVYSGSSRINPIPFMADRGVSLG